MQKDQPCILQGMVTVLCVTEWHFLFMSGSWAAALFHICLIVCLSFCPCAADYTHLCAQLYFSPYWITSWISDLFSNMSGWFLILILFSRVLTAHLSLVSSAYLIRMLTIWSSCGWTSVEPYPALPCILTKTPSFWVQSFNWLCTLFLR